MDTIIQNTQGADANNETSTISENGCGTASSYKRARKVAKRVATMTKSFVRKCNLYEWWYNLSTRRRAKRRARAAYETIVKESEHNIWDDTLDDYGISGQDGLPFHPPPPPTPMQDFQEFWNPYSEEALNLVEDRSAVGSDHGSLVAPTPAPAYKRGGRAQELAFAVDLHFGKMPYNAANYEVARRFASRHKLVTDASVRYAHQAALVKRAMHLYFITTEHDLVDHFILDNKVNSKRTKQKVLTQW
jgi:hypothetical protein